MRKTWMMVTVVVVVGGTLAGSPGCFDPQYVDGGLKCGAGGTCPTGLSCRDGVCRLRGGVTNSDAAVDLRAEAGPGPLDAIAEAAPIKKARSLGETCDPYDAGLPTRTDNCLAGLICVDGNSGSTCFRQCGGPADCGGAACESRLVEPGGATVKVCALAPATCSPLSASTTCGSGKACYLVGPTTTCDPQSGDGRASDSCTFSRDCLPGFTCAEGVGAGYCRRVCSADVTCTGLTCQRSPTNDYGYCF